MCSRSTFGGRNPPQTRQMCLDPHFWGRIGRDSRLRARFAAQLAAKVRPEHIWGSGAARDPRFADQLPAPRPGHDQIASAR